MRAIDRAFRGWVGGSSALGRAFRGWVSGGIPTPTGTASAPTQQPMRLDEIHVCDADEVVRAVLSNASPKSAAIISDMHTERLQNAADGSTGNYFNQYVFTCQADHEAADYLVEWAHVIRKDLDGNAREFRVRLLSTGRDNSGKATKTATCDGVEMELGKKRVRPVTYTGSTASAIMPDLLAGTRFTVGEIEWGGIVPV